jgi:heme-degrading monooxygenase HmoA
MKSEIVETVRFETRPEISEEDFLVADADFTEALRAMPGFRGRELFRADDHVYVDLIHWESEAAAKHAARTIGKNPIAAAFVAALKKTKNKINRYAVLRVYPTEES